MREAGGTVKWEEAREAGVEKKEKGKGRGNTRGQFQRIDRGGQRHALALGLAAALTFNCMGAFDVGPHTPPPPRSSPLPTQPDALTREVVHGKEQFAEGVADVAERRRDRAVELVHGELQPLQAGEVRADAVGNRALVRGTWGVRGGRPGGRASGRRPGRQG